MCVGRTELLFNEQLKQVNATVVCILDCYVTRSLTCTHL